MFADFHRTVWAALLLSPLVLGCGAPTASVSGTVIFKGDPLPSGTVLFHGSDGRIEHALIAEDGTYEIASAPLGEVRITVRSHAAAPAKMPFSGKPPAGETTQGNPEKRDGKFVAIPPRYLDQEKSGLTYAVSPGLHTHDIELQP
jgi:hypothetical protein